MQRREPPRARVHWTTALATAAIALLVLGGPLGGVTEPTVPQPLGYVSDYAGVIDDGTRRALESVIGELKAKTGAEIAVVTVRSTRPLAAFDYAMKIAEAWKPGAAGKDNGVVFLAAIDDRELFILTGYGVEGPLPDGRVGSIRDRFVVPAFRRGDYSGGIRAATMELAHAIAADAGVELTGADVRRSPMDTSLSPVAAIALFALLLGLVLFVRRHPELAKTALGDGRHRRFRHGTGGFGGMGGGGFGGFGGGGFGGGGAGGRW